MLAVAAMPHAVPGKDPTARLQGLLDEARRLDRLRRLRIQLPLLFVGMAALVASMTTSYSIGWLALSGFGGTLGPWFLLLSVLPTQPYAIGIALVVNCVSNAFPLLGAVPAIQR
jgi:hypothetical protein